MQMTNMDGFTSQIRQKNDSLNFQIFVKKIVHT